MFKKTIEFESFDGEKRTKEFYFHMSTAELLTLAAGGDEMMARLQRMVATKDMQAILQEFRAIIEMSCGIRSEDGERFLKTPEAKSELLDSPAYDVLLLELCTETDAAVNFINQLIPQKMREEMLAKMKVDNNGSAEITLPEDNRPAWLKEGREPTQDEIQNSSLEDLRTAFRTRLANK